MNWENLLDMGLVAIIMTAMEFIKHYDKNGKLKRFYPLFVGILGLIVAYFMTNPWVWKTFGINAMKYVLGPAYIYKFGKTTVLGK